MMFTYLIALRIAHILLVRRTGLIEENILVHIYAIFMRKTKILKVRLEKETKFDLIEYLNIQLICIHYFSM